MITIGIAGGSGSGKSTFVQTLQDRLGNDRVVVIQQDAYYRDQSHLSLAERKQLNFDHPDAIEWELMADQIASLHRKVEVAMPTYSMLTCTRSDETTRIAPAPILVVEGILIFATPLIRELLDLRVFLEVDVAHRLERILIRDMEERGRSEQEVRERFHATVAPMHTEFIEPTKRYANVLVPRGGRHFPAINVVASMVESLAADRLSADLAADEMVQ
jgi:uridine kinase